ncbi:uncharacterized protein METZ01_LOCUS461504, partial [marine metagenome]
TSTIPQTILQSSGSAGKILWDLKLEPSASNNLKSRLSFRINTSQNAGTNMSPSANFISMSSDYHNFKNLNFWNVLLQRTAGPSGSDTYTSHSYKMYIGENKLDKLRVLEEVSMSYGGNTYKYAAANWISTGSRNKDDSGNLAIGGTLTGSIAEIRTWKYPLSASVFKQHIYDKKSTVGNSILDSQSNIIYRFRLNENWPSGSSNPVIKDSNPKNVKDYSLMISESALSHRDLYDSNMFDRIQFSTGGGGAA